MEQSAENLCEEKLKHYGEKADHNKKESLRCFLLVMGATLAVPVFVSLGEGLVLGKILPSVLSLMAAFGTAWLQLRKPQALWGLYRTAERQLEINQKQFQFGLGDFEKAKDRQRLLAEKTLDVYRETHYRWLKLIPDSTDLKNTELEKNPDQ